MHENIFAYTARGANYPEYISLNQQEDKTYTLDIREPVKEDGTCGQTVRITLPKDEMALLGKAIIDWVIPADLTPS